MVQVQKECQEMTQLLDAWTDTQETDFREFDHSIFDLVHPFFLVRFLGKKWAAGEGEWYVYNESDSPLSRAEFQAKLLSTQAATAAGEELVFCQSPEEKVGSNGGVWMVPVHAQEEFIFGAVTGGREVRVRVEEQRQKRRYVGKVETLRVLSLAEEKAEELKSRAGAMMEEAERRRPTERLLLMVEQACKEDSSWTAALRNAAEGAEKKTNAVVAAAYDYLHAVRSSLCALHASDDDRCVRSVARLVPAFISLVSPLVLSLGPPPPASPAGLSALPRFSHLVLLRFLSLSAAGSGSDDAELSSSFSSLSSSLRSSSTPPVDAWALLSPSGSLPHRRTSTSLAVSSPPSTPVKQSVNSNMKASSVTESPTRGRVVVAEGAPPQSKEEALWKELQLKMASPRAQQTLRKRESQNKLPDSRPDRRQSVPRMKQPPETPAEPSSDDSPMRPNPLAGGGL